jgi:hypothetical protein
MSTLPTLDDIAGWPAPNYVDPVTRRPLVLGVEIPLTILTILFTAGRFYSRTVIVRALGWDDWFMLAATVRPHILQHTYLSRLTKAATDLFDGYECHDLHINAVSVSDWISSIRPST